jgi:hypothetical protein
MNVFLGVAILLVGTGLGVSITLIYCLSRRKEIQAQTEEEIYEAVLSRLRHGRQAGLTNG